jgi:2-polyprenyl-3-methyl-5-hydroxy-6-metoxy-1,4-benzoquinol methylase
MKCRICGGEGFSTRYSLRDFDVVACRGCDTVCLRMKGRAAGAEEVYSSEYFAERQEYFFGNSVVDPEGGEESPSIADFRRGLDIIEGIKKPGRLLDVGCAMGVFLALAKERGWEVCGTDISEYAARFASERFKMDCRAGTLRDAAFPDKHFDVITMWDVVEHFEDPLAELAEVRRVLADDGILIFDTPNEDSLMRLVAGMAYVGTGGIISYPVRKLYHEFHLYYYSPRTIRLLFEKAGFELLELRKKTIPITKARGNRAEKMIVRFMSFFERLTGREFEMLGIAKKAGGK